MFNLLNIYFYYFTNHLKMSFPQQSVLAPADVSVQNIAGSALASAQRSGAVAPGSLASLIDSPFQGSPTKLQPLRTMTPVAPTPMNTPMSRLSPLQMSQKSPMMAPMGTPMMTQGSSPMMTPPPSPMMSTPMMMPAPSPMIATQSTSMPVLATMPWPGTMPTPMVSPAMSVSSVLSSQRSLMPMMSPVDRASMMPLEGTENVLSPTMTPQMTSPVSQWSPVMNSPSSMMSPTSVVHPASMMENLPTPATLGRLPALVGTPLSGQINVTPAPSPLRQASTLPSVARSLFTPAGSYSEAVSGNYDNELMKNGYTKLDTVTIDTEGGERALYLKGYNICGDICYIDVTKPNAVTVQLANRTRVRAVQGSSIDAGVIANTQECVGNSMCGLAFDCENGFCVANKGDDGKSYTRTYTMVEEPQRKKIVPFGSPIAYPVITMDEIIANNEDCIERVRKATFHIQQHAMKESVIMMNHLYDKINKFNGSVRPPEGTQDPNLQVACVGRLNSVYALIQTHRQQEQMMFLKVLQNLRMKQANGMADATDLENMKKVTEHLYGLNLECARLLNMINSISMMKKKIHHFMMKIEDSYWSMFLESCTNVFQTANVRNPDGSLMAEVRSAKAWGLPNEVDAMSFNEMMQGSLNPMSQNREVGQLNRVIMGFSTPQAQALPTTLTTR
jgi:hypothetical protein